MSLNSCFVPIITIIIRVIIIVAFVIALVSISTIMDLINSFELIISYCRQKKSVETAAVNYRKVDFEELFRSRIFQTPMLKIS